MRYCSKITCVFFLTFGLIVPGLCPPAFSCEPCFPILSLEETIRQADLIVIAQKKGPQGPPTGEFGPFGPEWITIKVLEVLKGAAPASLLTVNSWSGMCDYGINLAEGTYVVFLQEELNDFEDHQFDAVNHGCSVKALSVEGDKVNVNGEEMSLQNLKNLIQ